MRLRAKINAVLALPPQSRHLQLGRVQQSVFQINESAETPDVKRLSSAPTVPLMEEIWLIEPSRTARLLDASVGLQNLSPQGC